MPEQKWIDALEDRKSSGLLPTFDEVVSIVQLAPCLRIAFDPKMKFVTGQEALIDHVRARVLAIHGDGMNGPIGLNPSKSELELFNYLIQSRTNPDYWDGVSRAVGRLVYFGVPLSEETRMWASDAFTGKRVRPKPQKGPHRLKHDRRDIHITYFLFKMEEIGYPITENDSTHNNRSACHAISDGLGNHFPVPSTKTLMNIWSSRSQNWRNNNGND